MSQDTNDLGQTITAMRPIVPAKNFEVSQQFYSDLGFQRRTLTDQLVEMRLGEFSFILQNYYVREWADNFVIHLSVSDVGLWWNHIVRLDVSARYGVKTQPPQQEDWGMVAGLTDPSGVLWRIAEIPPASY